MYSAWLSKAKRAAEVQSPVVEDTGEDSQLSQDLSDSVSEAAARVWWARTLVHHTHSLDLKVPPSSVIPVRVVSSCTGSFGEGACLKDTCCFRHDWFVVFMF